MKKALDLLIAALVLAGWGCAENTSLAGSGSETTNPVVSGKVFSDKTSRPVLSAQVTLVPAGLDPRSIRDTLVTRTDGRGGFSFDSLPPGFIPGWYNLLIQSDSVTAFTDSAYIHPDSALELPDIFLKPPGSLTGHASFFRALAPSLPEIYLPGTLYPAVAPDSITGRFTIEGLAEGRYTLNIYIPTRDFMPLDTVVDIRSGRTLILSDTLAIPAVRTLLDNFDDGDSISSLHERTGMGTWYFQTDKMDGGTSTVTPPGAMTDFALAVSDTGAWRGRSLSTVFQVDTQVTAAPYAFAACQFGSWNAGPTVDFTLLRGIAFMAKGPGPVTVSVHTKYIYDNLPWADRWVQFQFNLTLSDGWHAYYVSTDSLALPPAALALYQGLTWDDVKSSGLRLVFAANGGPDADVPFQLDDIYLMGMGNGDF